MTGVVLPLWVWLVLLLGEFAAIWLCDCLRSWVKRRAEQRQTQADRAQGREPVRPVPYWVMSGAEPSPEAVARYELMYGEREVVQAAHVPPFNLGELEAEWQRCLRERAVAGLVDRATVERIWLREGERVELLRPLVPTPEERAAAAAKAAQLLKDVLSKAEQEQVRRFGFLDVASPGHPGRSYRIPRRATGTIYCWEKGEQRMRLCVQAAEPVPADDFIVMQKLQIEGNEEAWLKTANRV